MFIDTANARETSPEIMEAIWWLSRGDEDFANGVWEAPTPDEFTAIWERVTMNGQRDATDFVWGALGSDWARCFAGCDPF